MTRSDLVHLRQTVVSNIPLFTIHHIPLTRKFGNQDFMGHHTIQFFFKKHKNRHQSLYYVKPENSSNKKLHPVSIEPLA